MLFGMSIYQLLWYFLIYSFIGWVIEVIYHAVVAGKIINRGFLNGPVCPIYGFGVVSVFILVYFLGSGEETMVENVPLWQLFLGGTLLATLVELIGGFLLDKLFHARWWDYSKEPFNLNGYICLRFSLIWGLCIAFVVRVIQPYFRSMSKEMIPERVGIPLLVIFYSVYLVDLVVTVLSVNRLNHNLAEIDKLQKRLRTVSNGLTDVIGGGAYKTVGAIEKEKDRAEKAGKELVSNAAAAKQQVVDGARGLSEALSSAVDGRKEKISQDISDQRRQIEEMETRLYRAIQKEKHFGMGRLLRAHPQMQHRDYPHALEEVRRFLNHSDEQHAV